jgi:hypothetical protein
VKWFRRVRERNSAPFVDTPYTYTYTLEDPPLPQPWRDYPEGVFFVPTEFVLQFADRARLSLVRNQDSEHILNLQESILKIGLTTPLEMWIDAEGKLRLQEGYHRMCVIESNRNQFDRVPIRLYNSNGRIKSYGRSIYSEFEFILALLGKTI